MTFQGSLEARILTEFVPRSVHFTRTFSGWSEGSTQLLPGAQWEQSQRAAVVSILESGLAPGGEGAVIREEGQDGALVGKGPALPPHPHPI